MAVTITTAENSFSVDGVWYRKGALTFEEATNNRIVIRGYVYQANEVLCDGDTFNTLPDLVTWLNASVFNAGGGNGEGVAGVQSVTGNLVSGTSDNPVVNLPVGSDRDVLTWDANGVSKAERINAWHLTDINGRPSFSFGVLAGASLQDDRPLLLFTEASNVAKSGTLPVYKSNGRLSAGVATEPEDAINLGQINGFLSSKADLINGKVPESFLPSYIDNVQEFDNLVSLPATGLDNVIYVTTDDNKPYRWGGTIYVEITSGVALGETVATAYRGDRGKLAYEHTLKSGNPHGTTKGDIGLGSVDNTSDLNKPISTATTTALGNKANSVHTHNISAIVNLQSSLDGKQISLTSGTNIKTLGGVSILGSGNIPIDVLLSSSSAGAISVKEYGNRTEYAFKIPFNQSIPIAGTALATGYFIPVGVSFANADEHYISIRNDQKNVHVSVSDATDRRVIIGFGNIGSTVVTAVGSVFVKLVKYK